VGAPAKKPPLVGGFDSGFPDAFAMLRFPSLALANLSEVLGNSSAVLLGLGVLDFVEVHHLFHFLSFFVS
jgi:hypothetical protein